MTRRRRGMALAVTIGVVSLIAVLSVATLSLAGRAIQTSTLGLRDARLDAGVELGLGTALGEWRQRNLGMLAVGASMSFPAPASGVPISVVVSVTRVASEIFWVTAVATGEGGASRHENVILRARTPDAVSLGAEDSVNVESLGFVIIDSLAADADLQLPGGSTLSASDGVIHVAGDATLTGGAASGILIVDGHLAITGPLLYEGVIIAREGLSATVSGVTIDGIVRTGGDPPIAGNIGGNRSAMPAQAVLRQVLTPQPVSGRRWGEMP